MAVELGNLLYKGSFFYFRRTPPRLFNPEESTFLETVYHCNPQTVLMFNDKPIITKYIKDVNEILMKY